MFNKEIGFPIETADENTEDSKDGKNKEIEIPKDSSLSVEENERNIEMSGELLKLKHIAIENYPELSEALDVVRDEMNEERRKYGLPEADFKSSDFRLIPEERFKKIKHVKEMSEKASFDVAGFHDGTTGINFIRFNKKKFSSSRSARLEMQQRIIHEGVHKGMDGSGIHDFSETLNEGITEKKARGILERRIVSKIFRVKDYENRKRFAEFEYSEGYDQFITPEDVLIWDEDKNDLSAVEGVKRGYGIEVGIIDKVREARPDTYKALTDCALRGDSEGARKIVESAFGKETAELLSNKRPRSVTFGEICDRIEGGEGSMQAESGA